MSIGPPHASSIRTSRMRREEPSQAGRGPFGRPEVVREGRADPAAEPGATASAADRDPTVARRPQVVEREPAVGQVPRRRSSRSPRACPGSAPSGRCSSTTSRDGGRTTASPPPRRSGRRPPTARRPRHRPRPTPSGCGPGDRPDRPAPGGSRHRGDRAGPAARHRARRAVVPSWIVTPRSSRTRRRPRARIAGWIVAACGMNTPPRSTGDCTRAATSSGVERDGSGPPPRAPGTPRPRLDRSRPGRARR